MDIYEIRKANLLRLMRGKTQKACADKWDTSASTLSQITSKNVNKNLGDQLARKIERAEGLPNGWFDVEHRGLELTDRPARYSPESNVEGESLAVQAGQVPVKGMARLGENGHFEPQEYDGHLMIHSSDPDAYGLKVVGSSMLPRIKHGEYVVIEPSQPYCPGDEVLVRTSDGQMMIKEYVYCRDGQIRLDSINAASGFDPLYLDEAEIECMHPVGAIVKPSRYMPD
jgi:phage repressor protein C with HTH and peptisase S24 domain